MQCPLLPFPDKPQVSVIDTITVTINHLDVVYLKKKIHSSYLAVFQGSAQLIRTIGNA